MLTYKSEYTKIKAIIYKNEGDKVESGSCASAGWDKDSGYASKNVSGINLTVWLN